MVLIIFPFICEKTNSSVSILSSGTRKMLYEILRDLYLVEIIDLKYGTMDQTKGHLIIIGVGW